MVRNYRFAVSNDDDIIDLSNKIITVKKQNLIHQLVKVLRLNQNSKEKIELIDGRSKNIYEVKIKSDIPTDTYVKQVDFSIESIIESSRELNQYIKFYIPIIKSENFELMLRKLCELGVQEFTPVFFNRSQKKYLRKMKTNSYIERLHKIIESATEQCEGAVFPKINPIVNFDELTLQIANEKKIGAFDGAKIFASEKLSGIEDSKYNIDCVSSTLGKDLSLLVGPEGGLTEAEVDTLKIYDFIDVSLGKRILKAETAAIVLFSRLFIN